MFPKYYNHITLSTLLPIHNVATCQMPSGTILQTPNLPCSETTFPSQECWGMKSCNWLSLGQLNYLLKKLKNAIHCFPEAPEKTSSKSSQKVVVVVVLWIYKLPGGITPYVSLNTYPGVAAVLAVTRDYPRANQAFIVEISYVVPSTYSLRANFWDHQD